MDRNHRIRPKASRAVVAPLAGAWIETPVSEDTHAGAIVAPLAGAWIETLPTVNTWVRDGVAPLAGAWIETMMRRKRESR